MVNQDSVRGRLPFLILTFICPEVGQSESGRPSSSAGRLRCCDTAACYLSVLTCRVYLSVSVCPSPSVWTRLFSGSKGVCFDSVLFFRAVSSGVGSPECCWRLLPR